MRYALLAVVCLPLLGGCWKEIHEARAPLGMPDVTVARGPTGVAGFGCYRRRLNEQRCLRRRCDIRRGVMVSGARTAESETRSVVGRAAIMILPPVLIGWAAVMGSEFSVNSLRPLRALGLPYPRAMDYFPWIAAAGSAILWIACLRPWPRLGSAGAVVLCFCLMGLIPGYGERRLARLPVRRWVEPAELKSLESTLMFPVSEQGSYRGTFVIVASENAEAARVCLKRLGLLSFDPPDAT